MARTTRTITFSLPPELSDRLDELTSRDGRTRSAFVRDALVRYMQEWGWRDLLEYGEQRARQAGIDPEDVAHLVAEYRAEAGQGRG